MVQMIEVERGGYCLWDIDGITVRIRSRKDVDCTLFCQAIMQYCNLLKTESYQTNPEKLCAIAAIMGDVALIRIGLEVFEDSFSKMYEHYSKRYIDQLYQSGKCVSIRRVNMLPVFDLMFKNVLTDRFDGSLLIPTRIPCAPHFRRIFEREFAAFWVHAIAEKIQSGEPLYSISERIGTMLTSIYVCHLPDNDVIHYFEVFARSFTGRRMIITVQDFYRMILKSDITIKRKGLHQQFVELSGAVVQREYEIQLNIFIAENHLQLDMNSDKWTLFRMHGPSLSRTVIDFTGINSPSLKREIQFFMKHRYYSLSVDKDQAIFSLVDAANTLVSNNPDIHFFADIDDVDVRSLYMSMERRYGHDAVGKSPAEIMRMFSELTVLMKYLMSDRRDDAMHGPVPHDNPFARYQFHNSRDYKVRTLIIPEDIAEQIDDHLNELPPIHALLYRIFSNTGMRTKEALFLEEDCLEPSRFKSLAQLKYTPYKTLSARRKAGISDYHRVLIPMPLADEIARQIKETAKLREEVGLPYIFIGKRPGCRASMISMNNYGGVINKLIERHDMRDESGSIWHFTSKQQRKTLAVTLIEEGASVEELAYWLSHLSRSSAANYYAEVRKMKLAELNTAFFREKFDIVMSGGQLTAYSEEERKLLYMDFRLDQRRVEFGYCLAKMIDGGCTKRSSLYNCVNCSNLCTGIKYLPYWKDLLTKQRELLDELIIVYTGEGVSDYRDFKEYKQSLFLLQCYENIVKSIESGVSS
ncbi:MAG: tyrosine-type recombinase/integrase [Lacrimispora sphenoides]